VDGQGHIQNVQNQRCTRYQPEPSFDHQLTRLPTLPVDLLEHYRYWRSWFDARLNSSLKRWDDGERSGSVCGSDQCAVRYTVTTSGRRMASPLVRVMAWRRPSSDGKAFRDSITLSAPLEWGLCNCCAIARRRCVDLAER